MKNFRTELQSRAAAIRISHGSPVLTLGSCFADSIGKMLSQNKFKVLINPLGTIYDPLSIHRVIKYIIYNELPALNTYVENQGIWSNYEFHSSLAARSKGEVEHRIIDAIGNAHHFLKDAEILILTYGTSRAYELTQTGELVANCHKLPHINFTSRLLQPDAITASFDGLFEILKKWKPDLKIIQTVSPVRHTKDTLEVNSLSKSILRLSCHLLHEKYPDVEYFPAYEIMMDDLRDYRFYNEDMIHPSDQAISYIWEKFSDFYFDPQTMALLKKWHEISAAMNHRPFHPGSAVHGRFLAETIIKLKALQSQFPVDAELKDLEAQLNGRHGS